MEKKVSTNKYIPLKNYMYVLLIFLVIIGFVLYIFSWYKVKTEEKLMTSYLISSNTLGYEIKNLTEVPQILKESANEYFVLISYTNDETTYKLEKKLKKIIDNYGLKDEFYYINVTDNKEEKHLITDLNNNLNTTKITNIPCLLYFKNGKFEKLIYNEDIVSIASEFENLLKEYEYEIISQ